MSNVSDFTFYGGVGFGGINKAQEAKTVYVPVAEPVANPLSSKFLKALVPRVYKERKSSSHKKKNSLNNISKKPTFVSKKNKKQKKHKKQKKVKKASNKKSKFLNF